MGQPRITLRHIADELGISVSTVSRVLNGQARRYRIGAKTEKAVRARAEALNFAPSQLARSLRSQSSQSIGLLVPDLSNPFFAGIAHAVTQHAAQQGYTVLLSDSLEQSEREAESVRLMRQREVEGLIICSVGQRSAPLRALAETGLPTVLVDRYFDDLALPYVTSDNHRAAAGATEYLIRRGHHRIACLCGLPRTSCNDDRVAGFRAAFESHDLRLDRSLIVGDGFGRDNGYHHTRRLLESGKPFTALFAFSNLLALGAIDALREAGRAVPDDVSVVCFDDHPFADHLATPMTAVAQDNLAMGRRAAEHLFARLQNRRKIPHKTLIRTRLIPRASVRDLSHETKTTP